tara:strand:- start:20 stop:784 length:765 start_codon:yes stop_codon:yes gene_type:complete
MIEIIILGIIQGITEFLPISSSGHLVIFKDILGLDTDNSIVIEIVLHFGTLLSILIFYRREIKELIKGIVEKNDDSISYFKFIIFSMFPIIIFVLFFEDKVVSSFSVKTLPITYLITSIILFLTRFKNNLKTNLNYKLVFAIGIAQVLAVFPGISRAGITISTAMLMGYDQKEAAKFSFFMAIPVLLGAVILKIRDINSELLLDGPNLLIGLFVSMITGIVFLTFLINIISKQKLWIFSIYCLILCVYSYYGNL